MATSPLWRGGQPERSRRVHKGSALTHLAVQQHHLRAQPVRVHRPATALLQWSRCRPPKSHFLQSLALQQPTSMRASLPSRPRLRGVKHNAHLTQVRALAAQCRPHLHTATAVYCAHQSGPMAPS